jgi:hypothetical protein
MYGVMFNYKSIMTRTSGSLLFFTGGSGLFFGCVVFGVKKRSISGIGELLV